MAKNRAGRSADRRTTGGPHFTSFDNSVGFIPNPQYPGGKSGCIQYFYLLIKEIQLVKLSDHLPRLVHNSSGETM